MCCAYAGRCSWSCWSPSLCTRGEIDTCCSTQECHSFWNGRMVDWWDTFEPKPRLYERNYAEGAKRRQDRFGMPKGIKVQPLLTQAELLHIRARQEQLSVSVCLYFYLLAFFILSPSILWWIANKIDKMHVLKNPRYVHCWWLIFCSLVGL